VFDSTRKGTSMEPDSEQKAEASFLLRAGNLAAGTFNANVSPALCRTPAAAFSRALAASLPFIPRRCRDAAP
jgi:hypothetical protein